MKKGSVTVLLALVFPAVLALVLTVIEAARFGGVRLKARDAGNAAVDSILAGYNRDLLDEYGLLFYDGSFGSGMIDYAKIEEEFLQYFQDNTDARGLLSGGSLLPVGATKAEIANIVTATDYNGGIFIRSALDYFKYDAVGELTDKIREYVDEIIKGDDLKAQSDKSQGMLEETDWGKSGEVENERNQNFDHPGSPLAIKTLELHRRVNERDTDFSEGQDGFERVLPMDQAGTSGNAFDRDRFDKQIAGSPIGDAATVKKGLWLSLVFPANTGLSGYELNTEEAPSHIAVDKRELNDEGFLNDAANVVLFNEYLMKNYASFTDKSEKSGAKYEVEYLIYGKSKDSDNLKTVLNRIMWIREGINLIYLMSSNHMSEAEAAASALFSWTTNPLIIKLAQLALVAAWAYGEAILDVRALLEGKRIDFIKNDDNWMLSFQNLPMVFRGGRVQTKESKNGLCYEDYLRILLYLTDIHMSAYRAMDLIQNKVREKAPDFLMESQIYAVEFRTECRARALFASLPVVKNEVRKGTNYQWEEYFSEVY